MWWLLFLVFIGLLTAAALFFWRNWIAPWRDVERLVRQIGLGENPRTFLVDGAVQTQRVALALEAIAKRQQMLEQKISEGTFGTQTIFRAMQDGLLVVDVERRITLANETLGQLFGLSEISVGANLLETIRDATLDQLIAETLRGGEPRQCELVLAHSTDRSARYIELSAVPMKNDRSEVTGAVVLFHDITELKKLDQVRRDFVANVSHELRTPLSILHGYIETLRDNPKTAPGELARILEIMERHSKRLALLVDDLLVLAQLESAAPNVHFGKVRVAELFRNVVHDWEKKFAEKELKVIVDLSAKLPAIRGDETRLHEVLYNLLDNAVKYSHQHGEIRLQAERRGNEIALSVSDNGAGIGKDDLPRIFERFYRVDKARSRALGGTGLGLSIVKHIAQLHGGRVEAESELGRGTTVCVLIPAVGASDRAPPAPVTQT
jgi:two-component system, OmpR family, phosphate regulon sensor histidine kinase PhoR